MVAAPAKVIIAAAPAKVTATLIRTTTAADGTIIVSRTPYRTAVGLTLRTAIPTGMLRRLTATHMDPLIGG